MTAQEIFDAVVNHLRTMPGRSMALNKGTCAYRGVGGNKCAVGAILTDEEYNAMGGYHIEGSGVYELERNKKFPAHLKPHTELLDRLQQIHDDSRSWNGDKFTDEPWLELVAQDFNLTLEPQK